MAQCTECGGYTKYNGGLCSDCYKHEKNASTIGLADKDYEYRYNMIKGRIAETLIQELFLSLDYNVFRYGMEHTIPGVMELLKGVRSDVSRHIRSMPDFVIQNRDSKEVYFVEVKFRANGIFSFPDLPKDYPYVNTYIIVVSKRHIKCLTVKELQEGKEITPESKNYLGNRKEFELDKNVIVEFCAFATQFFESV